MNRDDDIQEPFGRPSDDEQIDPMPPIGPEPGGRRRRPRPIQRPLGRLGSLPAPTPTRRPPPLKVPATAINRNVPTYPAWEKPPSIYNYPRLRGHEEHRSRWPLLVAGIGVVLLLAAFVLLPTLLGHPNTSPTASHPATPAASYFVASNAPSHGAGASASDGAAAPTPFVSFAQYKVVAGDSVAKIAARFGLKQWELLLANPNLADNPALLRVGSVINVPQPGQLTPPPAATPTAVTAPPAPT
ncbi:MAG: LysM domain-containing protein [Candidatus Limnocylindrales bacterium]